MVKWLIIWTTPPTKKVANEMPISAPIYFVLADAPATYFVLEFRPRAVFFYLLATLPEFIY